MAGVISRGTTVVAVECGHTQERLLTPAWSSSLLFLGSQREQLSGLAGGAGRRAGLSLVGAGL